MKPAALLRILAVTATMGMLPIAASAFSPTGLPGGTATPTPAPAGTGTGTTAGTPAPTGTLPTGLPGGIPGLPQAPPVSSCAPVKGLSLYDSYTVKGTDIETCLDEGRDPPIEWRPGFGSRRAAGGGSTAVTFAGKCPTDGKCPDAKNAANPTSNIPPVQPPSPVLNLPAVPVIPGQTTPPLPCGGSAALNLSQIISAGMSIGNNVRLGNVSSTIGTGLSIARSLLSPCAGGWQSLINNALNVVLPVIPGGAAISSTGGMVTPSGSVLMMPPGMTIDIGVGGGQIKLPDGGIFTDARGMTISIPAGGGILSYTASAGGGTVTLMDGSTVAVGNGTLSVKPGAGGMGGGVVLPQGITIPLDPNVPISTPTSSPNGTPPTLTGTTPTFAPEN